MALQMTTGGDGNMMYYDDANPGTLLFPWEAQQLMDQQVIDAQRAASGVTQIGTFYGQPIYSDNPAPPPLDPGSQQSTPVAPPTTNYEQNQIAPPIYSGGGGDAGGSGPPPDGNQAQPAPIDNYQAVADRERAQAIINSQREIVGYSYGMPVYADMVPNGGAGMTFDNGSAAKASAANAANAAAQPKAAATPVAPTPTQNVGIAANPMATLNIGATKNSVMQPISPYYQTTNDVQSQFNWTPGHAAQAAPGEKAWGIQQPTRSFDVNTFIQGMLNPAAQQATSTLPVPYPGK